MVVFFLTSLLATSVQSVGCAETVDGTMVHTTSNSSKHGEHDRRVVSISGRWEMERLGETIGK
jgi:hypothetical protein